jgi:hypothetical protein
MADDRMEILHTFHDMIKDLISNFGYLISNSGDKIDMHVPSISFHTDHVAHHIITWNVGTNADSKTIFKLLARLIGSYHAWREYYPVVLLQEVHDKVLDIILANTTLQQIYNIYSTKYNFGGKNFVILIPKKQGYTITENTLTRHCFGLNESRMMSIDIDFDGITYSIFNLHIQKSFNPYFYKLYALNLKRTNRCIIGGDFNRRLFGGELFGNSTTLRQSYSTNKFFKNSDIGEEKMNNATIDHIFYSSYYLDYLFEYRIMFSQIADLCNEETREICKKLSSECYSKKEHFIRKIESNSKIFDSIIKSDLLSIPVAVQQQVDKQGGYAKKYMKYKKLYLELKSNLNIN